MAGGPASLRGSRPSRFGYLPWGFIRGICWLVDRNLGLGDACLIERPPSRARVAAAIAWIRPSPLCARLPGTIERMPGDAASGAMLQKIDPVGRASRDAGPRRNSTSFVMRLGERQGAKPSGSSENLRFGGASHRESSQNTRVKCTQREAYRSSHGLARNRRATKRDRKMCSRPLSSFVDRRAI